MPEVDDARLKYAAAVQHFAGIVGARVVFTAKHGHLAGEITQHPDVADDIEALQDLIDLVEIGTAHICPVCGVDAGVGEAVEQPGGEIVADCLGCGAGRIVD